VSGEMNGAQFQLDPSAAIEAALRERRHLIRIALEDALADRRVRSFPAGLTVEYLGETLS
jgi:hypothetical protein